MEFGLHVTWSPFDGLVFAESCPKQAEMLLRPGFVDAQEIFGRIAPQILRQAYTAGFEPPSRPGLKKAYAILFAWAEALGFSPESRHYYATMFMGQLFNDVIDPSVSDPLGPGQSGENRLGAVLEYIQRDGEIWHVLMQLAAMHPDLPAPGWDPSGTVYLDQMFRMIMRTVAQSTEQALLRWNSIDYAPNDFMIRRKATQEGYQRATFLLAQQLIMDFQEERGQHSQVSARRIEAAVDADPTRADTTYPFAEPQHPGYLKGRPQRQPVTPPVWLREQPADWRTNLNFREERSRLMPWTRIGRDDDTPGSIKLKDKIKNIFIPGRRTRRRLWYRRRELQLQMLDTINNRPALLEDMCANDQREQPRPWGDPPIFASLDTYYYPFENCGRKPRDYRINRGIPIYCPRAPDASQVPPPPPVRSRRRRVKHLRQREKLTVQLSGCSCWHSDPFMRDDPTRACHNHPILFRCRRHYWTYSCRKHKYCIQCYLEFGEKMARRNVQACIPMESVRNSHPIRGLYRGGYEEEVLRNCGEWFKDEHHLYDTLRMEAETISEDEEEDEGPDTRTEDEIAMGAGYVDERLYPDAPPDWMYGPNPTMLPSNSDLYRRPVQPIEVPTTSRSRGSSRGSSQPRGSSRSSSRPKPLALRIPLAELPDPSTDEPFPNNPSTSCPVPRSIPPPPPNKPRRPSAQWPSENRPPRLAAARYPTCETRESMQKHLDAHLDNTTTFQQPDTTLSVTTDVLLDMSVDSIESQQTTTSTTTTRRRSPRNAPPIRGSEPPVPGNVGEHVGPLVFRHNPELSLAPREPQDVHPFDAWWPPSEPSEPEVATGSVPVSSISNTTSSSPAGTTVISNTRHEIVASTMVRYSSEYNAALACPPPLLDPNQPQFLVEVMANAAQLAAATMGEVSSRPLATDQLSSSTSTRNHLVTRDPTRRSGSTLDALSRDSLHPDPTPCSAAVPVSAPEVGQSTTTAEPANVVGQPMETDDLWDASLFASSTDIPLTRFPALQGAIQKAKTDLQAEQVQAQQSRSPTLQEEYEALIEAEGVRSADTPQVPSTALEEFARWLDESQAARMRWEESQRIAHDQYAKQAMEMMSKQLASDLMPTFYAGRGLAEKTKQILNQPIPTLQRRLLPPRGGPIPAFLVRQMEADTLLARMYGMFCKRHSNMLQPYANLEQQFRLLSPEVPLMREILTQIRGEAEYMWCLVEQSRVTSASFANVQVFGPGFPFGSFIEALHSRRLRSGLLDIPWAWVIWAFIECPTHISPLQNTIHSDNRDIITRAADYEYKYWVHLQGFPTDDKRKAPELPTLTTQVASGPPAITLGPGLEKAPSNTSAPAQPMPNRGSRRRPIDRPTPSSTETVPWDICRPIRCQMDNCINNAFSFAECEQCQRILCTNHYCRSCLDDHRNDLSEAVPRMQMFQQRRDSYLKEHQSSTSAHPLPTHSALRAVERPLTIDEEEFLSVVLQQEQWMRGQTNEVTRVIPPGLPAMPSALPALDVLFMAIATDDLPIPDPPRSHRLIGRAYDLGIADERRFSIGMSQRDRRTFPRHYEYLCHFLINRVRDLYHTRYWRVANNWENVSEEDWMAMVAAYIRGFRQTMATEVFSGRAVWTEELDVDMAWFLLAHSQETRNRVAELGLRVITSSARTEWHRRSAEERQILVSQQIRALLPARLDPANFGVRARNGLEGGEENVLIGEVRGSIDEDNAAGRMAQSRTAWLAQAERSQAYQPQIIRQLDPTFTSDQSGQTADDFVPLAQEATVADIEFYIGDDIRRGPLDPSSPAELGANKQKQATVWEFSTDPDTGKVTRRVVPPSKYHAHVGPGRNYWRLLKCSTAWMSSLKNQNFTIPFFHKNDDGHGPIKNPTAQPMIYDVQRSVLDHMREQMMVGLPRHAHVDLNRLEETHIVPQEVLTQMRQQKENQKRAIYRAKQKKSAKVTPTTTTASTTTAGSETLPMATMVTGSGTLGPATVPVDAREASQPPLMGPPQPASDPRNRSVSRTSTVPSVLGLDYINVNVDDDLQSVYSVNSRSGREASCQIVDEPSERSASQKRKAQSSPEQDEPETLDSDVQELSPESGLDPTPSSSGATRPTQQPSSKKSLKRRRQRMKRKKLRGAVAAVVPAPDPEDQETPMMEDHGSTSSQPSQEDPPDQTTERRRVSSAQQFPTERSSASRDVTQPTSDHHTSSSSRRPRSSDPSQTRHSGRSSNETQHSGSRHHRHRQSNSSHRHRHSDDRERHATYGSQRSERQQERSHRGSSTPRHHAGSTVPRTAHSYGDIPHGYSEEGLDVIPNRFRDGTINPNVLVLRNPSPSSQRPQNRTVIWQPTQEELDSGYYQQGIWTIYPRRFDGPPPPPGAGGAGFSSQY